MTEWEYKVELLSDVQIENQLNFVGKEGWELVQVLYLPDTEYPYQCFLKRSKERSLLKDLL